MSKKRKIITVILLLFALGIAIFAFLYFREFNYPNPLKKSDINKLDIQKYNNLMIVAHPDDESFWGGAHLVQGDWFILCITRGYDDERKEEFLSVLEKSGDGGLILAYPDKIRGKRSDWSECRNSILSDIEMIMDAKDWETIVTHNELGEYGHIHHKMTNRLVSEAYQNLGLDCSLLHFGKYYSRDKVPSSLEPLSDELFKKKLSLIASYDSQDYARKKFSHMFRYENWQ